MTDADALLKSLPQPIAVVGNGVIRSRHDEIESHRTVIRFNDYADLGYERHVGHTIHVWCVTCCGNVKFRTWPHPVQVMTIATLAEQPVDLPRWLERYPDMGVPAESWIRDARGFKGANPTTGLTLLLRMLMHKLDFTAFGFDGGRSGHYWNRKADPWHSHGDEFAAILKLSRDGVRFA